MRYPAPYNRHQDAAFCLAVLIVVCGLCLLVRGC